MRYLGLISENGGWGPVRIAAGASDVSRCLSDLGHGPHVGTAWHSLAQPGSGKITFWAFGMALGLAASRQEPFLAPHRAWWGCKCYANAKHQDVIHHILSPHWFWIGLFHFGADLSTGDTPSVGMETVYRDDIKCLDTVQLGITLAIENPLTKRRKLSQIAQDAPKSRQIPIFSNHWARQAAGSESMGFMAMTYGISRGFLYGIYLIRWDYDIDWNYEISVLHGFLWFSMYFWDNLRYTDEYNRHQIFVEATTPGRLWPPPFGLTAGEMSMAHSCWNVGYFWIFHMERWRS